MREVRHITVAVSPELYRQTRRLAAEYDTTVTALVAYLLERLPRALEAARYPKGGEKPATASQPAEPAATHTNSSASTSEAIANTTPVRQYNSLQSSESQ
jgi:hypothetical protein